MAEICREHNLVPRTVYGWKEKFLAGGRSSLDGPNVSKQVRWHKKEITSLKRIIGEYAVANNALKKKRWRAGENECRTRGAGDGRPQHGAPALRGIQEGMVLHLQTQERIARPRGPGDAPKDRPARPTYGTRRMAAQAFRELNRPVNRKAARRIFKGLAGASPRAPNGR